MTGDKKRPHYQQIADIEYELAKDKAAQETRRSIITHEMIGWPTPENDRHPPHGSGAWAHTPPPTRHPFLRLALAILPVLLCIAALGWGVALILIILFQT
ncbi:hypothetical protein [Roseovarius sp. SYSU LYC5161]|uniref:hypothetical protein n=1 Tax=Roseovarius halophilus (ex Wu et al. 2025) TaxID=3376060 RepID=UPI003999E9DB